MRAATNLSNEGPKVNETGRLTLNRLLTVFAVTVIIRINQNRSTVSLVHQAFRDSGNSPVVYGRVGGPRDMTQIKTASAAAADDDASPPRQ